MPTQLERAWWFVLPEQSSGGPATCSEIEDAILRVVFPSALYVRPVDDARWVLAADVPRFRRALECAAKERSQVEASAASPEPGELCRYTPEDEPPTIPNHSVRSRAASARLVQWPSIRRRLAHGSG